MWQQQDEDHLRELLAERRARVCRANLIPYVQATFPDYMAASHLVEIAAHLEMVERGEIDRLLIIEPPRHGKSLLVSQRFPAWYLGRNPSDEVIHCSYGGELATAFGRRLRNLMLSAQHIAAFPDCQLSPDSKAANLWHTSQEGVYTAAGVGGPITGRGAHMLLIDDPVKSREEADSETMRNRTWDWYQNDAYTRLMPGGRVIVISTRWHDDDLVGRLLSEQERGGDTWTVLHHPAISTDEKACGQTNSASRDCGRSSGLLGLERGKLSTRATHRQTKGYTSSATGLGEAWCRRKRTSSATGRQTTP